MKNLLLTIMLALTNVFMSQTYTSDTVAVYYFDSDWESGDSLEFIDRYEKIMRITIDTSSNKIILFDVSQSNINEYIIEAIEYDKISKFTAYTCKETSTVFVDSECTMTIVFDDLKEDGIGYYTYFMKFLKK